MKLLSLFSAALLAVASLSPVLAADTYEFDPAHSTIGFRIRHLFSDVSGRFNKFSGKIVYDEAAPDNSLVEGSKILGDDVKIDIQVEAHGAK